MQTTTIIEPAEIEVSLALTTTAPATPYDYGQIDEGIRDEVKAAARAIHQLGKGVGTGIIAIGKRLVEVKCMIPHGQFTAWIEGEFGLSERVAQNYMNVAREFGNGQNRTGCSVFSPSVLYLLAAPSTPPAVREQVEVQFAATGKPPTHAEVKRLRDERKPSSPSAPARAVYVEPVAEPEPKASNPLAPLVTKIEEIDGVTVHHMEFAAVLPPSPASEPERTRVEIAPGLVVRPFGKDDWMGEDKRDPRNIRSITGFSFEATISWAKQRAGLEEGNWPKETKVDERATPDPDDGPVYTYESIVQRLYRVAQNLEPGAGIIMLEDYLEGREGWYHDLLIGYRPLECDDALFRQAVSGALAELRHDQRATVESPSEPPPLPEPEPDPRIEMALTLRDHITTAVSEAKLHYYDLTGMEVETLPFYRGAEAMIGRLDRLLNALQKEEPTP